ncbi:thermonuclease family protein [Parasphingorhabdus cellanae]|uniref:Thermonuclease family protein n=1 Tax=Parasphingorhabdus cellanae TaxID=2806553 RepID=A0ABX7T5V1_9SPHN|nr:thermonuclease family protein [Parasphingorhabdus cellanae]QTD55620.1 thermonuclease family protein [Parasphingorhabdus cellanae]
MASKFFRNVKTILLFLLIVGGSWAFGRWAIDPETITVNGKTVQVIDGDSFKDAATEYRIYGIDAPEYRQLCKDTDNRNWPCGKSARTALEKRLSEGQYSCEVHARDKYGRTIVTCSSGNQDLGAAMVEQGHAISSDSFDQVVYGREEASAEKAKRGIWQGSFETPSSWRASHPR